MKQNTLAKQLNLRNFRRRVVADAYARAKARLAAKKPLVLVQLELPLEEKTA